jgi:uncharacterized protein YndB with AHSA1/START domain
MDESEMALIMSEIFESPPETVFEAWSNPEEIEQWFGPEGLRTSVITMDFKVGGAYRFVMKGDPGGDHTVHGVYKEIIPGKKLVFTWDWEDAPMGETVVTVIFEPEGAGTRMTFTHSAFPDQKQREMHALGWGTTWPKLKKVL